MNYFLLPVKKKMSQKFSYNVEGYYIWRRKDQMFRKHLMPISKSLWGMVWHTRIGNRFHERYNNFRYGQCYVSMCKNGKHVTIYNNGDMLVLE